jgi:hypothetical protein
LDYGVQIVGKSERHWTIPGRERSRNHT